MLADKLIPDLSSGNVLVQGCNILLCDSEILRGVGAIGRALGIHANYGLVEQSVGELHPSRLDLFRKLGVPSRSDAVEHATTACSANYEITHS